MSHLTICKSKIRNPHPQILRLAMEAIAKELGSEVVEDYVVRGGMYTRRCLFAIPMRLRYGNGYGVCIKPNGEVEVVVDEAGAPLTAREFAEKLNQFYAVYAVCEAARHLGFTVQSIQQVANGFLIDLGR